MDDHSRYGRPREDILTRITRELANEGRCLVCDTPFDMTAPGRMYCSSKCRRKGSRAREKLREERERIERLTLQIAAGYTSQTTPLTEAIDTPEERTYPDTPTQSAPPPAPTLDFSTLTPPHDPYEKYLKK